MSLTKHTSSSPPHLNHQLEIQERGPIHISECRWETLEIADMDKRIIKAI